MSYTIKYHEPECRLGTNCQDKDCSGYHYARWEVVNNDTGKTFKYTSSREAELMCASLNGE